MINIEIKDQQCRIIGDLDIKILKKLDKELSFDIPGAQYVNYYGKWDGKKHLLDSKRLNFGYGLLERVKSFFDLYNIKYRIEDTRIKTQGSKIDLSEVLKDMNKSPRDYQIEASNRVYNYDCGIIKAPTGSGKSLTGALMIANLGKKTVFLVIGNDLLHQTYKNYKKIFGNDQVGIVGDGLCEIKYITVASVWTVGCALGLKKNKIIDETDDEKPVKEEKYEEINKMLHDAKVVILDECQIASCDTVQEISKVSKAEHIYGLSASPWRDDNSDLLIESFLGKKIFDIDASYLIDNGYLVKPIIKFIEVPKYHERLKKQYQTVYKKYIIENDVRNDIVVEQTKKLISLGYKVLVLYDKLPHGKKLFSMLSTNNVKCHLLSCKDQSEVRDGVKDDLSENRIDCIIASRIFDAGVDIPALSALVMASGGKSSVRTLQRVGRVIRPYPGKKNAAVVDFLDNAPYLKEHSKIRKKVYEIEKGFDVRWPKN